MGEIVRGPGSEKLARRNRSERRVRALQFQLSGLEVEGAQAREALAPECGELVEQSFQRLRVAVPQLGFTIERVERTRGAVFQDDFEARQPIGLFDVDQVPEDNVRAPGP